VEGSLFKGLIPFTWRLLSLHTHLPKALSLDTVILGIGFQYMDFGGHINIQITATISRGTVLPPTTPQTLLFVDLIMGL
jgi:hypothetical protein